MHRRVRLCHIWIRRRRRRLSRPHQSHRAVLARHHPGDREVVDQGTHPRKVSLLGMYRDGKLRDDGALGHALEFQLRANRVEKPRFPNETRKPRLRALLAHLGGGLERQGFGARHETSLGLLQDSDLDQERVAEREGLGRDADEFRRLLVRYRSALWSAYGRERADDLELLRDVDAIGGEWFPQRRRATHLALLGLGSVGCLRFNGSHGGSVSPHATIRSSHTQGRTGLPVGY